MMVINPFFFILLLLVSLPIVILAMETFSAVALKGRSISGPSEEPNIAVIIPAYNEESCIASCIASVAPSVNPADKIVVVADNCSDSTAFIAQSMGAYVVKREDKNKVGKGYALAYGISSLSGDPPDVVVIIDADVTSEPGAIQKIASLAYSAGLPVQGCYLLMPPNNADAKSLISSFAFCFKNLVRPLGLFHLGFPCLLTGSGSAIPWSTAASIPFESGSIVEDMQISADLATAGHDPLFCSEARFNGRLPTSRKGAMQQRKRWEHGHLGIMFRRAPKLLFESVKQRRIPLLFLGLNLLIPPLSFLVLYWTIITAAAFGLALFDLVSWIFLIWAAISGGLLILSIFLGWFYFAREILPLKILAAAPVYAFSKIPMYVKFFIHPEKNGSERNGKQRRQSLKIRTMINPKQMNIRAIIVNYKTSDLIIRALPALVREIESLEDCLRITIVDNDSSDGSLERINEAVSGKGLSNYIQVIAAEHNGGFAYGNNIGLKDAKAQGFPDMIWLLNPDTIIRPGAARELIAFMKTNPDIFICGSRLEHHDGTPQISAFNFPTIFGEFLSALSLGVASKKFSKYLVPQAVKPMPHPADWLAGASVMIKREVFDKIGFMDERYFLYFEEVDFFFQAKQYGFDCWYVPLSRVFHEAGASTGAWNNTVRQPSYWFESRRRFFLKNRGALYSVFADTAWIIGYAVWIVRNKMRGNKKQRPPHYLKDFIFHSVFFKGFHYDRHDRNESF